MGSLFRILETKWLIKREDFHSYRSSLKETLEAQFVSTKVCRQNNEHLYMCGAPPRGHLVFHYKRRPAKILAPHISCGSQNHKTYQRTTTQVAPNCHEACGPGNQGWQGWSLLHNLCNRWTLALTTFQQSFLHRWVRVGAPPTVVSQVTHTDFPQSSRNLSNNSKICRCSILSKNVLVGSVVCWIDRWFESRVCGWIRNLGHTEKVVSLPACWWGFPAIFISGLRLIPVCQ